MGLVFTLRTVTFPSSPAVPGIIVLQVAENREWSEEIDLPQPSPARSAGRHGPQPLMQKTLIFSKNDTCCNSDTSMFITYGIARVILDPARFLSLLSPLPPPSSSERHSLE